MSRSVTCLFRYFRRGISTTFEGAGQAKGVVRVTEYCIIVLGGGGGGLTCLNISVYVLHGTCSEHCYQEYD